MAFTIFLAWRACFFSRAEILFLRFWFMVVGFLRLVCFGSDIVFCVGKFHEVCFYEAVDFAVHHACDVAGLESRSVVFDPAVVEHVGAYLASPFDFLFAGFDFCLLCFLFLQCAVVQLRAQQTHGVFAILELLAALGVFDKYLFFLARVGVFLLVAQAHAGFHFVHVLSACAAASEEVPAYFRRVDVHFNGVVYERCDENARK